jgi:hypothetical protein
MGRLKVIKRPPQDIIYANFFTSSSARPIVVRIKARWRVLHRAFFHLLRAFDVASLHALLLLRSLFAQDSPAGTPDSTQGDSTRSLNIKNAAVAAAVWAHSISDDSA